MNLKPRTSDAMCDQTGAPAHATLRLRLRAAGMVLLSINDSGQITARAALGEDWLADLLCSSNLFRHGLTAAARTWGNEVEPSPMKALDGVWLIPMPLMQRRRRIGYSVAAAPTASLLTGLNCTDSTSSTCVAGSSESLSALCQSARPVMDVALCAAMLAQAPGGGLAGDDDIARIASLVRFLHEDHVRLASSGEAIDSVGRQLAESYEEMNLLYTIIQSMTVQERPERFVAIACQELLATLPFAWIGVLFGTSAAARAKVKGLAGRLIIAGEPGGGRGEQERMGRGEDEQLSSRSSPHSRIFASSSPSSPPTPPTPPPLRDAARRLLERAVVSGGAEPIVLDTTVEGGDASFAALGRTVIAHPIMAGGAGGEGGAGGGAGGGGQVIGLLIAGEKRGSDTAASSVDAKLIGATASHMAIFLENAALYDDLNAMFLGTLEALTASIDAKDRYTCGHSRRVAHLTQQLARAIGLDEHTVGRCHIAGLVHDVGKIGVPEAVLLKPGKLTSEEFGWIRKHPEMGYRILKDIPQLADILPGVLHHHERWDGKGYPECLVGERIPLVARLIGLADSFDAMSSTRTYRSALSRKDVLTEIERCAGEQFDPHLARAFVKLDFSEFDRMVLEHQAREAA